MNRAKNVPVYTNPRRFMGFYQPPKPPETATTAEKPKGMRYATAGERPPSKYAPGNAPDVIARFDAFMKANPQMVKR